MKSFHWLAAPLALLVVVGCKKDSASGNVCRPATQRCEANALQVCDDHGERWIPSQDCSATKMVCEANLGCLACFPGATSCSNDGVDIVRCRPDGSAADKIGVCDPEMGEQCNGGRCVNACEYAAASKSYEGCDYWAVDLDNAVVSNLGTAAAQQFSIVVSNPLELPAIVTVEVNDSLPGEEPHVRAVAEAHLARIVGGGDLAIIDLDPREVDGSTDPHLNDGPGTFLSSRAFHIRSTAPIVAYQFNPLDNVSVFSNDASLLIPSTALGIQYLAMGWEQTIASPPLSFGDLRSFLTIVGTTEKTDVSITLSTPIIGGGSIPPLGKGQLLNLTIGAYDVINLETGSFRADFTATSITSTKPIAVFSGSEAADVPYFSDPTSRQCCADHLEEQLFPESAFGTQFVAVRSPSRTKYVEEAGWDVAVQPDEADYWRILASGEDTTITTNLPEPNNSFFLSRGGFVTFASKRDFTVRANHPISFAQFPVSQEVDGIPSSVAGQNNPAPGGDPSFIMIPPLQQWRSKYVFLVPNKYAFDFLLLAVPVGANLLYDGILLEEALPRCEYEPIGKLSDGTIETEYQALRCPLSQPKTDDPNDPAYQDDGRHVLESLNAKPFGLVVWGWDSYVSYGYPGGTDIREINPL